MPEIPWILILPAGAFVAFIVGISWKHIQDTGVETYKRLTIKPGDLNVRDLEAYARTHSAQ